MDTLYKINWNQFWCTLFAVADLNDYKKSIILKILPEKSIYNTIPIPFEYQKVQIMSLLPSMVSFNHKTDWFKRFKFMPWKKGLSIRSHKMDLIIICSDTLQRVIAIPQFFSEVGRVLVPNGRLVMGLLTESVKGEDNASKSTHMIPNPQRYIAQELDRYHFTSIIVGRYSLTDPLKMSNLQTDAPENLPPIIATATHQ